MAKHRNKGQNFVYNQLPIHIVKDNERKVIFIPSELNFEFDTLLNDLKEVFPTYEISLGEVLTFKGNNREVLDTYLDINNEGISKFIKSLNADILPTEQIQTRTDFITLCILQRKK